MTTSQYTEKRRELVVLENYKIVKTAPCFYQLTFKGVGGQIVYAVCVTAISFLLTTVALQYTLCRP
jgi:hypothetical protein